ncbi:uncharacterized protein LOC143037170 [Oratosquilla oratoria]|uniref:uncharacterized protein LOC143037170 n=1 Tax=Oratosquilla oratoria TaxID=337810 RepID=UPI003F7573B0
MSLRRLGTRSLRILDSTLDGRSAVKDLGVLLDENLSFEAQINKVVKVAGYHLRNIGFVRKYLDEDTVKMLLHNYVISRLDYCNSLYFGLPKYRLRKLQYVMNRAVRLLRGLAPRERVTPVLMELHWLPIKARIVFKICLLTFRALKYGKPEYLRSLLNDFQVDTTMGLRHSDEQYRLNEPRSNLRATIGLTLPAMSVVSKGFQR